MVEIGMRRRREIIAGHLALRVPDKRVPRFPG